MIPPYIRPSLSARGTLLCSPWRTPPKGWWFTWCVEFGTTPCPSPHFTLTPPPLWQGPAALITLEDKRTTGIRSLLNSALIRRQSYDIKKRVARPVNICYGMHQLDQEGKLLRVHMRLFICNPSIHPSAHLKAVSGHRHHDVKQDDVGQQRGQGQELHGVLRICDLLNLQNRHLGDHNN